MNSSKFMGGLLLLGGIPLLVSGIFAMAAAEACLRLSGVSPLLTAAAHDALAFAWSVQGGQAALAGFAFVAVALFGGFLLRVLMTGAMFVHGVFAIWLIPAKGLEWCAVHENVCTPAAGWLLYASLALNVVLVLGCVLVLGLIATGGAQEKRGLRFSRKAR